jgi:hypothetical protein
LVFAGSPLALSGSAEVGVAGKLVSAVSSVALPEVILLVGEITRMGRSAAMFPMRDIMREAE